LPPQVRVCIVLGYHAGLTQAEISQVTAIPLGTVKSHTRRGTKRLQDFLSAYCNSSAMMEVP
jgi:RNA polymerase sigma-70 factor (ECF subfamily)